MTEALARRIAPHLFLGVLVAAACTRPPESGVPLAAATFEPSPSGALISVWSEVGSVDVVVADDATGQEVAVLRAEPDPERGDTTAVEVANLEPSAGYRYHLERDGQVVADGYRFRTAPAPESEVDFSFVYGADIDLDPEFSSPILGTLADLRADFTLVLGDAPYADNPPGARTLAEYRARHRELRRAPRMQALFGARGTFAIYDDHELRNDWDGRFRDIEAERIEAGLTAWDEFHPLRRSDRRYRSWRWGRLAEVFLLDTRLYRSANDAPDGPDKTMLGAEQLAWLQSGLAESDAPFKLIVTSVPLDFCDPVDCWAAFARERDELIEFIHTERLATVVFLTGDQHWFAVHHFASGLAEVQVGPVARGIREPVADTPEQIVRAEVYNYGEVRITGGPEPRLEIRGRDAEGEEIHAEVLGHGIGALRVEGEVGRAFQVTGAHTFSGTAPARFDYAPVGRYRLRWDGAESVAEAGELGAGEELTLGGEPASRSALRRTPAEKIRHRPHRETSEF